MKLCDFAKVTRIFTKFHRNFDSLCKNKDTISRLTFRSIHTQSPPPPKWKVYTRYPRSVLFTTGSLIGFTFGYTWMTRNKQYCSEGGVARPDHTPSRVVSGFISCIHLSCTPKVAGLNTLIRSIGSGHVMLCYVWSPWYPLFTSRAHLDT